MVIRQTNDADLNDILSIEQEAFNSIYELTFSLDYRALKDEMYAIRTIKQIMSLLNLTVMSKEKW